MKFINLDGSSSLEAFGQKQAKSLMKRIDARHEQYRFKMSIKPHARKPDGSVKLYEVVGTVKIKGRGELRAAKRNRDAKLAVHAVVSVLEKQLRRHSEKSERSRSTIGKSLRSVREFKIEVNR